MQEPITGFKAGTKNTRNYKNEVVQNSDPLNATTSTARNMYVMLIKLAGT